MNPRDNIEIVGAALRWSTAHARRQAASAAKRLADIRERETRVLMGNLADCSDLGSLRAHSTASMNASAAAAAVSEAKRLERAAMRDLAKACERVRRGQDAGVIELPAPIALEAEAGGCKSQQTEPIDD